MFVLREFWEVPEDGLEVRVRPEHWVMGIYGVLGAALDVVPNPVVFCGECRLALVNYVAVLNNGLMMGTLPVDIVGHTGTPSPGFLPS